MMLWDGMCNYYGNTMFMEDVFGDQQLHVRAVRVIGSLLYAARQLQEVRRSFAYSLFVHSFDARRDRVVLLPPCSLYGAATLRPPPLGPGRGLTLPCGWNNAGSERVAGLQRDGPRTRERSCVYQDKHHVEGLPHVRETVRCGR